MNFDILISLLTLLSFFSFLFFFLSLFNPDNLTYIGTGGETLFGLLRQHQMV